MNPLGGRSMVYTLHSASGPKYPGIAAYRAISASPGIYTIPQSLIG
jgi:hypothetical protein